MSIYETIANEVVERLVGTTEDPMNLGVLNVDVQKLIQFKGRYIELPTNKNGRILIGFPMHNYGTEKEPTDLYIGSAGQESDLYISAAVSCRTLYDEGNKGLGMYSLLEITQRLVLGLRPSCGNEISLHSVELTDFDEHNVWHYTILFRIQKFIMVPANNFRDESPLAPGNLTEINWIPRLCEEQLITNVGEDLISFDGEDLIAN